MYQVGQPVVYRISKQSTKPGTRAIQVRPSPRGDHYSYCVDKFWRVEKILPGGAVCVRTRRGKRHVLDGDDCNLRPARWWERVLLRRPFPTTGNQDKSLAELSY
ncbi:hypothetical protein EC9_42180 [Rosistilla ulvae]|uniref:Uncharacterized protein n=1 Tax=Rosistilla ulvae TaxID=1930277 RepID=A0A517M565_9BACT|nr:hypothetical protein EC9_42180 [Rosistilla ulvae]